LNSILIFSFINRTEAEPSRFHSYPDPWEGHRSPLLPTPLLQRHHHQLGCYRLEVLLDFLGSELR